MDLYEGAETFFYLDPPYVPEKRKGSAYEHEMSLDAHERLISCVLKAEGKIMLSGYSNPLYESELRGWSHRDFTVKTSAWVGKNAERIERVWLNYEPELTLF